MSKLLVALARNSAAHPGNCALSDGATAIDYGMLYQQVAATGAALRNGGARVVALALPNSPHWIIADLAVLSARLPCVPVPPFFSTSQDEHLFATAGVDTVITDQPERFTAVLQRASGSPVEREEIALDAQRYAMLRVRGRVATRVPANTAKVTYTSGTTGAPKGVCLDSDALAAVAGSLVAACQLTRSDRHGSLLPLATLLENVAVYAHLQAGSCVVLRPLGQGTAASGTIDGLPLMRRLGEDRATTAVLIPEMLRALVEARECGAPGADALRLLAVGGAPVSKRLLARAAQQRLPVYEGYGLSECGSVVALNTAQSNRPGTVGRPLPHVRLRLSDEGEILVRGALFQGYVGEPARHGDWHRTGDKGALDADGHLRIIGREKNIFITSHGRNVAPEWIESELTAHRAIAQAWVSGEARPWNVAVIVAAPGASATDVERAVRLANAGLPDYARVQRWLPATAPFSGANGQLTPNGRLRRDALPGVYDPLLDRVYAEELHVVS